jgi:hypothetical protein
LLAALLSAGGIVVLSIFAFVTTGGFFFISSLAGAVGLLVTYLVAGLRVVPPPYRWYAHLGCGIASWVLVTALTLPVPDEAFTTLSLLGLPFAAIGGLLGGRIHHAFLGSATQRRPAHAPPALASPGIEEAHLQHVSAQATVAHTRPAKSYGLTWRLIAACLLGVVAVPFGLGEPRTLVYSLVVLGVFAAIAIVLDLSLEGWRPELGLLLCCVIAIAWGGGSAILQATGQYLFYLPTGAAAQAPFAAFVSICALLCLLSVEGAHVSEGTVPGEQRTMVQLGRHLVFWLAAGLLCWLGIAAILLWRGAPGMPMGEETPGQLPLAAALPLVMASLPAVLIGALVGGALRWALTPDATGNLASL